MNYTERQAALNSKFQFSKNTFLPESNVEIKYFSFQSSTPLLNFSTTNLFYDNEKTMELNSNFIYPIFAPKNHPKSNKAILLLHGLNERSWNKYLVWAEYLCSNTGRPVILFPMAYHINRSPESWCTPRNAYKLVDLRRQRNGNDRLLSIANVAFSDRISQFPYRFYSSGRQTLTDITTLLFQIKSGLHSVFMENTQVDIFAYSIGAFLSEIALLANPQNLFGESKLFMFCGGSIFSEMKGESRLIMDQKAFTDLFDYYMNDFNETTDSLHNPSDSIYQSFYSMLLPEHKQKERYTFFDNNKNRIQGISLEHDTVIPYNGIVAAMGSNCATNSITTINPEYKYTHENPFPTILKQQSNIVNAAFETIFGQAADFF